MSKHARLGIALLLAAAFVPATAAVSVADVPADRPYTFEHVEHGECLTEINQHVVRTQCNNKDSAVWIAAHPGVLRNKQTGRCLTTGHGDTVTTAPCDDSNRQRFKAVSVGGGYEIRQTTEWNCLYSDGAVTRHGGAVAFQSCKSGDKQQLWERNDA